MTFNKILNNVGYTKDGVRECSLSFFRDIFPQRAAKIESKIESVDLQSDGLTKIKILPHFIDLWARLEVLLEL